MTDIEQVPPARDLSADRKAAVRDFLVTEVARSRPWWRRSRRLAVASVIGGTSVILVGSAAAAYVAFRPATDQYSVVCYAAPQLEDVYSLRLAAAAPDDPDGAPAPPVKLADPIAACSDMWATGVLRLGATAPADPDDNAVQEVPSLVACTLDDNTAGVFPGDTETCERLGLPRTTPLTEPSTGPAEEIPTKTDQQAEN